MDGAVGRIGFITLTSVIVSVALTGTAFFGFGFPGAVPAMALAVICPLVVCPPVVYHYFKQARRTEIVCGQLAEANRALEAASSRLVEMARRDGLTGLLNRNAFFQAADIQVEHQGGAMMMIDADHFKQINDRHGHASGDAALIEIASVLRACLEPDVLVGRIGGEEFGVLVPGMSGRNAWRIADQIRCAIAAETLSSARGDFVVTVSIGVAACGPGVDIGALYKASDDQLLQAKRGGRNRTQLLMYRLAA